MTAMSSEGLSQGGMFLEEQLQRRFSMLQADHRKPSIDFLGHHRRLNSILVDVSADLAHQNKEEEEEEEDDQDLISDYGSVDDRDEEAQPFVGKMVGEGSAFAYALQQSLAIAVTSMLLLMTALPFGAAYFPTGWSNDNSVGEEDDVRGSFPLPGKMALGLRMCLFSTIVGQLVLTYTSRFTNSIACQLLENVPFFHALARIVIAEQGYGIDALSTLFFLFGLSSVSFGAVCYALGKLKLGRIFYFFPSHVLVGLIGGIGIFIMETAVGVTTNTEFALTIDGLTRFVENFHLFWFVLLFEAVLRLLVRLTLDSNGQPTYPLLPPMFFLSIIPVFYIYLYVFDVQNPERYFFPRSQSNQETSFVAGIFDGHVLDMFSAIDLRLVSWTAVRSSLGTVVAMVCFSLLNVPIMVPTFAISSNVDFHMNDELIAHGYANALSGIFGGLPNIMTYSFGVLYLKSGGGGKASSLALVAVLVVMFVVGPQLATLVPREYI
jgi:SulP family sulfate permease